MSLDTNSPEQKVPRTTRLATGDSQGAYLIYLRLRHKLSLNVGSLGRVILPAGRYAYIGSARRGITARVVRHRRLNNTKLGKPHWHVDYLLLHPEVEWSGSQDFPDCHECHVSKQIALLAGASAPVARFGATDCQSGCRAHLYQLNGRQEIHQRN